MKFNRNAKPPENIKIPNYLPDGVVQAKAILDAELQKGKDCKFLVYYDPDIDGLMAGLLVEEYLNKMGFGSQYQNYKYYLNNNRAHGFVLTDSQLEQLKGYTIIAVDFSISKKDMDRILRAGINIINIDHHEININEYTSSVNTAIKLRCGNNFGVIINNQYDFEPDNFKFLSGAGMVYYFLKYVSDFYNVPVDTDYPAMVGITLLSDIRELERPEARSFLKYTYSLNSEYMKYLQWLTTKESFASQRFSPFGVPCMSRDYIDFTFSPIINSLLRADKGDDALNLLRGHDATIAKMKDKDSLFSYRDIQKRVISAIMKELKEAENRPGSLTREYSKLKVCCLTNDFVVEGLENFNITNYIGVACSKIKDEDKTGVIVVIDKDTNQIIRGSLRGGKEGIDYLEIFQNNNVPSAGHHNAFGILACDVTKIDFEQINRDIERVERECKSENTRTVLEVQNLEFFSRSPSMKQICRYNSLSRDNFRIYLKYTGNTEDKNSVHQDIISDKYCRYIIDGVTVDCYDPTIDLKEALIQPGFVNNNYIHCTLREGFDYNLKADLKKFSEKLASLNETIKEE